MGRSYRLRNQAAKPAAESELPQSTKLVEK